MRNRACDGSTGGAGAAALNCRLWLEHTGEKHKKVSESNNLKSVFINIGLCEVTWDWNKVVRSFPTFKFSMVMMLKFYNIPHLMSVSMFATVSP